MMPVEIKLKEAVPANIEEIIEIENSSFETDRFNRRQFSYLLKKANSRVVIALLDESPAGYLILLKRKNSNKLRVYSIAVKPEKRGLGISRKLLDFAFELAEKKGYNYITLEVNEGNKPAINLYSKNGFVITGYKENYYEDGSRALLMSKKM